MSSPASAFDAVARQYDSLWSDTSVGRLQRQAFWRHAGWLFRAGEEVLDLGCGTGDDALYLERAGVRVVGIDASPEMVRIAVERGVDARLCRIEEAGSLDRAFDGAISNFGPMNCIRRPQDVSIPLAALIRPGGYVALCMMGRFCLWETLWYLMHGKPGKAIRRWKGHATSSLGVQVFYPTLSELARALSPEFALIGTAGIGAFVPPFCVRGLSGAMLERLDRIDRRIAGWPMFAAIADHRIVIFRRA